MFGVGVSNSNDYMAMAATTVATTSAMVAVVIILTMTTGVVSNDLVRPNDRLNVQGARRPPPHHIPISKTQIDAASAWISSSLMGSLAKGFFFFFFFGSLRKFCGKFAEMCRTYLFIASGKGVEILWKAADISQKFAEMFCNGAFPNDPISEWLIGSNADNVKDEQDCMPALRVMGRVRSCIFQAIGYEVFLHSNL